MSLSRMIARPLLGAIFVAGGLDAVRNPASKVPAAERVVQPLGIGQSTENVVRLNGVAQVGGGALLALGIRPRLAATVLIGSIVPTTLAGHRFWEEDDDGAKAQQQVHFLKNLGLLGGLILAAMDTDGKPSLGWWARRAARRLEARVEQLPGLVEQLPGLVEHLPGLVEDHLPGLASHSS